MAAATAAAALPPTVGTVRRALRTGWRRKRQRATSGATAAKGRGRSTADSSSPPPPPPPPPPSCLMSAKCKRQLSQRNSNGALILLALLNLTVPQMTAESEAAIKVTRFQVPNQPRLGELRRFSCAYELQGATLHAMKLFKGDKEFYRFTPPDKKLAFPVDGLQIDLNKSDQNSVWLRINKFSPGNYTCQVSVEGTFNSVSARRSLELVPVQQLGGQAARQPGAGYALVAPQATSAKSAAGAPLVPAALLVALVAAAVRKQLTS